MATIINVVSEENERTPSSLVYAELLSAIIMQTLVS
jgi:hypothetical protein